MGDNTNFSAFVFNKAELYAGGGSFTITSGSTSATANEFIAVEVGKRYKFSYAIKELAPYNALSPNAYSMIDSYDIDKNNIYPSNIDTVSGSALTTLAAALNPGDTTIKLVNATGWHNSTTPHMRKIRMHKYVNSQGYEYPGYTYSRWVYNDLWDAGGVNVATNTITLRVPWAGPAYAIGHPVANALDGGTFIYPSPLNFPTPKTWQFNEGIISNLRAGTAFIKIGWLLNRDITGTATTAISSVSFGLDEVGAL
jgi:hypothetical protein